MLVELLPALPTNWAEGRVTGLRLRGGVTMDLGWRDHRAQTVTLNAGAGIHLTIEVPGKGKAIGVELRKGEVRRLVF